MRKPADTDFFIELPEVGTFRFGRRTFGDRPKIKRAYLKFIEKNDAVDGQCKVLEFLYGIDLDPFDGWDSVKDEIYRRAALSDGTDFELAALGNIIATYSSMCSGCPPGWEDLEKLDVTGNDNENLVFALHKLLRDKENSFRPVANTGGEAPGQGT